jgi:hypothetical protein
VVAVVELAVVFLLLLHRIRVSALSFAAASPAAFPLETLQQQQQQTQQQTQQPPTLPPIPFSVPLRVEEAVASPQAAAAAPEGTEQGLVSALGQRRLSGGGGACEGFTRHALEALWWH